MMIWQQNDDLNPEKLVGQTKELGTHFWEWVQKDLLTWHMAVELGVVVLALVLAWALVRPVRLLFVHLAEQMDKVKALAKIRPAMARFLAPVLPATLVLVFLLAAQVGLQSYHMPHALARTGVSLAAAFIVIRLVSGFINEPFWSRTMAQLAWLAAALNIFGWLKPVLKFLDTPLPGAKADSAHPISALLILKGLALAILLLWLATRVSGLLRTRIERLPALTPSVQLLLSKAVQVTLISIAIIFALSSIGVDLKSLALIGGALSFGIGFGLQRIFANLISGIMLLLDRSIKPGDVIEVDDTYGRVTSLGLRYTSVVTRDRKEHLIPNENFVTGKVVNWSFSSPIVRIKSQVGIAYDSDVPKAMELAIEAARSVDRVLDSPQVVCQLREFGDSAVVLELRFWIRDSHNGVNNVSSEVNLNLWNSFHENGIEFPFPQRDVNFRAKEPVPVRMEPPGS